MSAPNTIPLALANPYSLSLDKLRASGLDAADVNNLLVALGWYDNLFDLAKAAECIDFPAALRQVVFQCVALRRRLNYHTGDATIPYRLMILAAMQVGYAVRVAEKADREREER